MGQLLVMAVFCMSSRFDRDLMIPLPKVNLGEHWASGRLGGEVQQVWQRIDIRLRHRESPQGRQIPSAFLTMH
jgi:hypothetical protein